MVRIVSNGRNQDQILPACSRTRKLVLFEESELSVGRVGSVKLL